MVESISREHGGKMNKTVVSLAVLLFGALSPFCSAQDKPKAEDSQKAELRTTPVKVQVVFTEFEGDKKVKSLPYILYVNAPDVPESKPGWVKLRVGSRVNIENVRKTLDRKSTRLNSSHSQISYAVFCLKKKKNYMVQVAPHADELALSTNLLGRLEHRAASHSPIAIGVWHLSYRHRLRASHRTQRFRVY